MSLFKRFGRRLAAISAIAVTACGTAPAAEPKAANPALWKVADHDTTIYLFGTIHLLPKDTKWRSSAFDTAAAGADTLVVETVIDESNPAATMSELLQLAVSPGACRRSPTACRPKRRPRCRQPSPNRASRHPCSTSWKPGQPRSCCLEFSSRSLAWILDRASNSALKKQFSDSKKPIGQLETNAEQLGFFDRLSEDVAAEIPGRDARWRRRHEFGIRRYAERLDPRRCQGYRPKLQ